MRRILHIVFGRLHGMGQSLLILFDSDKRVYYIEKFGLNIGKA